MRPPESRRRGLATACAVLATALPAACATPDGTRETGPKPGGGAPRLADDVTTFVLGNIEYVLLHEIAHFLIAEKEFPVIGPEENAADYIATWALLSEPPFDPAQRDRPIRFLVAAAGAFAVSWRDALATGTDLPYWSQHALGIQRYFQIVCLMYGSDPAQFERLPQIAGLPASRARGCEAEYARADRSIRWLIGTYGRKAGGPPGAATELRYEPPRTAVSARIVERLESLALVERTLERLTERFSLEQPLRVVLRACGQAEAAWIADRRELVICYELVDHLYTLALSGDIRPLEQALPNR